MVQALTPAQKLFLQRMMAAKVMSDDEAKRLYREITALVHGERRHQQPADDFERFVGKISSHLKENFDLDVRTAIIFHEAVSSSNKGGGSSGGSVTTRYHAFVNRVNDKPAELYGAFNKTPHEVALFKVILEKLIEQGKEGEEDSEEEEDDNDDDDDDSSNNEGKRRAVKAKTNKSGGGVTGCTGYLSVMDMLALRSELTDAHEGKLTLQQTQDAIDKFIQEKWLVPKTDTTKEDGNKRRSSSGSASSRKRSRSSSAMDGDATTTNYQIGPRTYMELDTVLRDMGLSNMPQFITLRSS